MAEHNPYAPPTQPVAPQAAEPRQSGALAGRGRRLAAAMVDTLLMLVLLVPAQFALGVYDDYPKMQPQSLLATIAWSAASFTAFVVINGLPIARSAQTLGKKLLGIKIVDLEGHNASFRTIVLQRMLPVTLASMVPYIGGLLTLVDALTIFRADHRTLHDRIAGTRVVVS